jgi:hypothetical protein
MAPALHQRRRSQHQRQKDPEKGKTKDSNEEEPESLAGARSGCAPFSMDSPLRAGFAPRRGAHPVKPIAKNK